MNSAAENCCRTVHNIERQGSTIGKLRVSDKQKVNKNFKPFSERIYTEVPSLIFF